MHLSSVFVTCAVLPFVCDCEAGLDKGKHLYWEGTSGTDLEQTMRNVDTTTWKTKHENSVHCSGALLSDLLVHAKRHKTHCEG